MKTFKQYNHQEKDFDMLLESASDYLTEEEISALRENPQILQEVGPAIMAGITAGVAIAKLISKYGRKAYDAAKKLLSRKGKEKEYKPEQPVDSKFDRNQKLGDFGPVGPKAQVTTAPAKKVHSGPDTKMTTAPPKAANTNKPKTPGGVTFKIPTGKALERAARKFEQEQLLRKLDQATDAARTPAARAAAREAAKNPDAVVKMPPGMSPAKPGESQGDAILRNFRAHRADKAREKFTIVKNPKKPPTTESTEFKVKGFKKKSFKQHQIKELMDAPTPTAKPVQKAKPIAANVPAMIKKTRKTLQN